jgi:hypothetical protein
LRAAILDRRSQWRRGGRRNLTARKFGKERWVSSGLSIRLGVGYLSVDRVGFSHHPEPKRRAPKRPVPIVTKVRRDQCPKGQRPEASVQKASVKRASTLRQPASLSAANWQGKAKARRGFLGPPVAPVVLFVSFRVARCDGRRAKSRILQFSQPAPDRQMLDRS